MTLTVRPITIKDAKVYIKQHHRHHLPPVGALFAVAVEKNGELCGVATVGRPVARKLSDGYTAEVTRCCTNGARNACSMLYGAAWRACKALGYKRLITYTLKTEIGSSLRGAGWIIDGYSPGGSWSSAKRPRIDKHPLIEKVRWSVSA